MRVRNIFACALSLMTLSTALADDARKGLADKHAPAGIMGEHVHDRGEWMVEYRYMNMYMEDNRIGTQTVSDQAAITFGATSNPITNRGATPTDMTMEMHMLHLMYGVTDEVSLYTMLMLPSLTMDHLRGPVNPATGTFTTHNSGFGDTAFGALLLLYEDNCRDLIFNLGCSVPTGDIYRESTIPTAGAVSQPLPYPMRLGSGTFNFRPGITYKRFFDLWSWGAQLQTNLPFGNNYRGYSVSDEYRVNTWASLLMIDWLSLSIRAENLWRSRYDGADPAATDAIISTNVEQFRGGYLLNLGAGLQANVKGHYINLEVVPTLTQNLNGIQLETDFSVVASWSKAW